MPYCKVARLFLVNRFLLRYNADHTYTKENSLEKHIRLFISIIAILLITANLGVGFMNILNQLSLRPAVDPGIEFADLKERLQGVRQAGFLTEAESSAEGNDGRFLLAQYMLAPTMLDLNNPTHRYNVLHCATPQAAIGIMKIIGAKPVYVNIFGKIIAERSL